MPPRDFLAHARFAGVVELTSRVREFRQRNFSTSNTVCLCNGALVVEDREIGVQTASEVVASSEIKSHPFSEIVMVRFRTSGSAGKVRV